MDEEFTDPNISGQVSSKISLKTLQESFYQSIFDSTGTPNAEFINSIDTAHGQESTELVDVYRGSILGGLIDALSNIYPVCLKLVGQTFFNHMVEGYLRVYPSDSPDLADYGENLPTYIADFQAASKLVYLSDIAALEWYWHKAFNAADVPEEIVESLSELAAVAESDQARIRFFVHPSVNLIQSRFPLHRIWQVNQEDYTEDPAVNLDEGAVSLVIWRNAQFGMRIDVLSEDEFEFLAAVIVGKVFSEIAALPCASSLLEILGRCMQTGLLVGFQLID